MKRSDAFPSTYISKDDVQQPLRATIASVQMEDLEYDGKKEKKPVMYFQEDHIKPLIVNTSNFMTCEDAYGDDSDHWTGKPIEIYCDPTVAFGGKRVGGVRLRLPVNGQTARPPAGPRPAGVSVQTALLTAWQTFNKLHQGEPEIGEQWKAAFGVYFQGAPKESITPEQWQQFTNDGFKPSGISAAAKFDEADIPF